MHTIACTAVLVALRTIEAGEELNDSYIGTAYQHFICAFLVYVLRDSYFNLWSSSIMVHVFCSNLDEEESFEKRQADLRDIFRFNCTCAKCIREQIQKNS